MRGSFGELPGVEKEGCSVLIQGEKGTGRGYLAREIHSRSRRHDRPFLVHDCRSRGSLRSRRTFLGEVRELGPGHFLKYLGLLEEVRDGTLYLNEIERLPRELQSALCDVMETGCFSPIGSDQHYPFRARVIFSTTEGLDQAAETGKLHPDFHRVLSRGSITVSTPLADP